MFWLPWGDLCTLILASCVFVLGRAEALFTMILGRHGGLVSVGAEPHAARRTQPTKRPPMSYAPRTSFTIGPPEMRRSRERDAP